MKKKLISLALVLVMVAAVALPVAADYAEAVLAGARVTANCNITQASASATTGFDYGGTSVGVSGSYVVVKLSAPYSSTTYPQGNHSTTYTAVNPSAPTGYRSVRIDTTHTASHGGQSWSKPLSAVY